MTGERDPLIAARLMAVAWDADDSDWGDVLTRVHSSTGRLRRRRRRPVVVALVVVAVLGVVVAPAVAFRHQLVHLFSSSTPAPRVVRRAFATLDVGAPPGMAPHVIPRRARVVLRRPIGAGRTVIMWAAPTRAGGFCTLSAIAKPHRRVSDLGGGCDRNRRLAIAPGLSIQRITSSPGGTDVLHGPVMLTGDTLIPAAATIEITYADGSHASIRLNWISKPIAAAFFGYSIPAQHWTKRTGPVALVVKDADGHILLTTTTVFAADPLNTPLPRG